MLVLAAFLGNPLYLSRKMLSKGRKGVGSKQSILEFLPMVGSSCLGGTESQTSNTHLAPYGTAIIARVLVQFQNPKLQFQLPFYKQALDV